MKADLGGAGRSTALRILSAGGAGAAGGLFLPNMARLFWTLGRMVDAQVFDKARPLGHGFNLVGREELVEAFDRRGQEHLGTLAVA